MSWASHGYGHQRASDLDATEFFTDIDSARKLLEDISENRSKVTGRRVFQSEQKSHFRLSERVGYQYSSSIYLIRHDHYGMPDAPRLAHKVREGLLKFP